MMINYEKQNTISIPNYFAFGFENIFDGTKTRYYLADYNKNLILIFNESWIYESNKTFNGPFNLKQIENTIYITTVANGIFKTDLNLTILQSYQAKDASYYGIYYNQEKDLIYVANHWISRVDVFERNLTLSKTISLGGINYLNGVNGFNNQLFVSTSAGYVFVLDINDKVVNKFMPSSDQIYSILIDQNGIMSFTCYYDQLIRLSDTKGNALSATKKTSQFPVYMAIDSKGRMIVLTYRGIDIYF